MSTPLLTIAVPTYNRAPCLSRLLDRLSTEINGLEDSVQLVVSDNGSTDSTDQVIQSHLRRFPATTTIRHSQNQGPDANFAGCLDAARGKYFWIFGDDDLPRPGAVKLLVDLLANDAPDLVYLHSQWQPDLTDLAQQTPLQTLRSTACSAMLFAQQTHVWTTFISGIIVNLDMLRRELSFDQLVEYTDTNMIQLGWVLPCLEFGHRFIRVSDVCVLATSNNTGGYKVMEVFGAKFPRVTRAVLKCQPHLSSACIRGALATFLPGLAWDARFKQIGNFAAEHGSPAIQAELAADPLYWLFMAPIMKLPKPCAFLFYLAYQAARRLVFRKYRADLTH